MTRCFGQLRRSDHSKAPAILHGWRAAFVLGSRGLAAPIKAAPRPAAILRERCARRADLGDELLNSGSDAAACTGRATRRRVIIDRSSPPFGRARRPVHDAGNRLIVTRQDPQGPFFAAGAWTLSGGLEGVSAGGGGRQARPLLVELPFCTPAQKNAAGPCRPGGMPWGPSGRITGAAAAARRPNRGRRWWIMEQRAVVRAFWAGLGVRVDDRVRPTLPQAGTLSRLAWRPEARRRFGSLH